MTDSNYIYLFKSNGFYFGFIRNNILFNRDGIYLGWLDGSFAWDINGQFKGQLYTVNGNNYILQNQLLMPPTARVPRPIQSQIVPPIPVANISPITLPVGVQDSF